MDVPLLQGTKPVTTTSAWMRAGCGGGAPDATAPATATTPITSRRRLQAMDARAEDVGCSLQKRTY
jgi:hypothetical protein